MLNTHPPSAPSGADRLAVFEALAGMTLEGGLRRVAGEILREIESTGLPSVARLVAHWREVPGLEGFASATESRLFG
ncbi:hypothetical protein J2T57_001604 [Natronocella acetinitrilica]|uniref:Uncharacterized protein n=1 Tax=Natronocella acetinitrilica TaxID=414046 RepID=A0AAE3G5Z7_9GAMM|nr:hypothetical protein [Natronocella acetinitrilica]MCP1674502.1 hypothetical protein [Natronocella acetinitrilica]